MPSSASSQQGSPGRLLTVRCATRHHRVGEALRAPGGVLWLARLPAPSRAWAPVADARVLRPQPGLAWPRAAWHTEQLVEGPEPDAEVLWGCRCTAVPQAWLTEDLWAAAHDPRQSELLIWP